MDALSKKTKVMHSELTRIFSRAFAEAQKKGVNIKKLHWFNSESKKDAKEKIRKKRVA